MKLSFFKYIIEIVLFSSILPTSLFSAEPSKQGSYRLILRNSEYPYSFDPLDADMISNMDFMKMRYFTPIEIDSREKFTSSVLTAFTYNPKSNVMTWKVRRNIKYADGTQITPDDIILAIKRMALKRSGFPVINAIKGLKEWSLKENPLTHDVQGIKLTGNIISISFVRHINSPFFHFSSPIFAIQPTHCFDLKTSKPICDIPPASGYYDFVDAPPILSSKDGKYLPISFILRKNYEQNSADKMPLRISFIYTSGNLSDAVNDLDENTVISTVDSRLTNALMENIKDKVDIIQLPQTGIRYLLLNPTSEPFKDKTCRRIFANQYRVFYAKHMGTIKIPPRSFSSPVMPGYLTNEQLDQYVPTPESHECLEKFKKYPIKYKKINLRYDDAMSDTMNAFGMPTSGIYDGDNSDATYSVDFEKNLSASLFASVGCWPKDLSASFSMFFTANMHSELKYVLEDGKLSDLSDQLFKETDHNRAKNLYEKINILLYEEALLNPLSFYGDAYVSKVSKTKRPPITNSEPNPWHLFVVKK